jgi:hypothetical protein
MYLSLFLTLENFVDPFFNRTEIQLSNNFRDYLKDSDEDFSFQENLPYQESIPYIVTIKSL